MADLPICKNAMVFSAQVLPALDQQVSSHLHLAAGGGIGAGDRQDRASVDRGAAF